MKNETIQKALGKVSPDANEFELLSLEAMTEEEKAAVFGGCRNCKGGHVVKDDSFE